LSVIRLELPTTIFDPRFQTASAFDSHGPKLSQGLWVLAIRLLRFRHQIFCVLQMIANEHRTFSIGKPLPLRLEFSIALHFGRVDESLAAPTVELLTPIWRAISLSERSGLRRIIPSIISCFCFVVSWRRWKLVEITQASASARVPSH